MSKAREPVIVDVVRRPRPCAVLVTSSHSAVLTLSAQMIARTSSSFSLRLASALSFCLACSSRLIMKSKLPLISAIFSHFS